MGCICGCFNVRDPEDDLNSSNDSRTFIHAIFDQCGSLFRESQTATLPSTSQDQEEVSSTSGTLRSDPGDGIAAEAEKSSGDDDAAADAALSIDRDLEQQQKLSYISLEHVKGQLILQKLRLESPLKSSEDEDVCPTCLEEYSSENPRTVMQCSHHYHLSCIYEWMERSALCPVCSKVMMFDETT